MSKFNPINIFIVEDNKVFTMALKANIESAFSKMPIKIHTFLTGEACILEFKKEKPLVVILDYQLNSTVSDAANGIQVLDLIKQEDPETCVIMLTGNDSLEIALKSFKHGASDYVVKSDTKFSKINYSLMNILNMMQARADARMYKSLTLVLFLGIALTVVLALASHLKILF